MQKTKYKSFEKDIICFISYINEFVIAEDQFGKAFI